MLDPLEHFFQIYGFDISQIKSVAIGSKYLGIMLTNGQIGVCAILRHTMNINIDKLIKPDLSRIDHRILYTAYLNAHSNYERAYHDQKDIFDLIDFTSFENIVMVGYFRPLVKKFLKENIDLKVFDLYTKDSFISPLKDLNKELLKSDCIILTSTSIFNNTFAEIINLSPERCSIFILGPSSILHEDMLKYKNIKNVFGIEFNPHDDRILKVINENHGTPAFSPFGKKVYI